MFPGAVAARLADSRGPVGVAVIVVVVLTAAALATAQAIFHTSRGWGPGGSEALPRLAAAVTPATPDVKEKGAGHHNLFASRGWTPWAAGKKRSSSAAFTPGMTRVFSRFGQLPLSESTFLTSRSLNGGKILFHRSEDSGNLRNIPVLEMPTFNRDELLSLIDDARRSVQSDLKAAISMAGVLSDTSANGKFYPRQQPTDLSRGNPQVRQVS